MIFLVSATILIFLNFPISSNSLIQNDRKVFCMYLTKSAGRQGQGNFQVDNINSFLCTHLIYAYLGIENNGQIKSLNPMFDFLENGGRGNIRIFNSRKHYNPSLKTLVAVGGWDQTENSGRYSTTFSNEENQNRFVSSAVDFVINHDFNGLVLHWAYPGMLGGDPNIDKATFPSLLKKLKQELGRRNLLLVVVCSGLDSQMDMSYNVRLIVRNVDYIYLASYDLYTEYGPSYIGIASGLYLHPTETNKDLSADSVVNSWIRRGAPSEKLVMGVPLFGRTFTLKDKEQTVPGSPHSGPGQKTKHIQFAGLMSYMELCQRLNDDQWTIKWEDTQKNPYAFKDDQWVGYENERSLEIKSKYVIERNLAGIAAVFVEDDDFLGICGEKYSRLKIINSYLRATARDADNEYILNISVYKQRLNNSSPACVYHSTDDFSFI